MLIHPVQSVDRYPVGTIVEAGASPGDGWMICKGQVLSQSDYPVLFSLMEEPHPVFEQWDVLLAGYSDYGVTTVLNAGGVWVGTQDGGTMAYSADGESWSSVSLSSYNYNFTDVAHDGSLFVSICDESTPITPYITSADGQTWTEQTLPIGIEGHAIAHDGTNFYLVSYDDTYTLYSPDGTTWTSGGALQDTYYWGLAASADVVVAVSYDDTPVMAVSTDAIVSWSFYTAPFSYPMEITYDSIDDIFVMMCKYDGVYAVSPGDDGVNWDVRMLPIHDISNARSFDYTLNSSMYRIRKAGNYWFAIGWYTRQLAYSSDLINWSTFPVPYNEWYDVSYNSSTGNYYLYGYGTNLLRWSQVREYDTAIYFKIPNANRQFDNFWQSNKRRYIRVK